MQIVDLAVWWADEVESLTAARAGAMSGTEPSDALRVSLAYRFVRPEYPTLNPTLGLYACPSRNHAGGQRALDSIGQAETPEKRVGHVHLQYRTSDRYAPGSLCGNRL